MRFRNGRRRRVAALALLPLTAIGTTTSIALAANGTANAATEGAQISASDHVVGFGRKLILAGSVPGRPVTAVGLQFRGAGSQSWRTVQQFETDAAGNYKTAVRAERTGTFQATPDGGTPSGAEKVKVRARSAFHVANRNPIAGQGIRLHGRVLPGGRRKVRVMTGAGSVKTQTNSHGAWSIHWRPPHAGSYRLRVHAGANALAVGGHSEARTVTAFRPALASWYGPGLYGGALACGGSLQPGTMGVANRTLPCGTKLTLRYGNRSVRVAVIDRGPFAAGREFDLTAATKEALHFPDVGTVLSSR